jgi:hypothetical protein
MNWIITQLITVFIRFPIKTIGRWYFPYDKQKECFNTVFRWHLENKTGKPRQLWENIAGTKKREIIERTEGWYLADQHGVESVNRYYGSTMPVANGTLGNGFIRRGEKPVTRWEYIKALRYFIFLDPDSNNGHADINYTETLIPANYCTSGWNKKHAGSRLYMNQWANRLCLRWLDKLNIIYIPQLHQKELIAEYREMLKTPWGNAFDLGDLAPAERFPESGRAWNQIRNSGMGPNHLLPRKLGGF